MPFATKALRDRARAIVAHRVRAGECCTFCHRPIDLTLRYPDPFSFVVDHKVPTSRGGGDESTQWRAAHHRCNRARSNHGDGTVGRNSGVLG